MIVMISVAVLHLAPGLKPDCPRITQARVLCRLQDNSRNNVFFPIFCGLPWIKRQTECRFRLTTYQQT